MTTDCIAAAWASARLTHHETGGAVSPSKNPTVATQGSAGMGVLGCKKMVSIPNESLLLIIAVRHLIGSHPVVGMRIAIGADAKP